MCSGVVFFRFSALVVSQVLSGLVWSCLWYGLDWSSLALFCSLRCGLVCRGVVFFRLCPGRVSGVVWSGLVLSLV